MGKRRVPKSQWASQGFERTGFANWLDYNRNTDTLRYGTYDINPELVGLKRNRATIDPKSIKSLDDVFRALGADQKSIDKYNQPLWNIWGNTANRDVFTGKDAWKNDAATQMWNMIRPQSRQEKIYGRQMPNSIDSRDPAYQNAMNQMNSVGSGMLGAVNMASSNPLAALMQRDGGRVNTIANGMGGANMGWNIPSLTPKATTYHKIFKGEDGMLNFEFGDLIPDDQAFAQKVSDMAWQLSKQGYNSRWGKDPGGVGKDPKGNPSPSTQGKAPTILGS